jgi:hypothetical protein
MKNTKNLYVLVERTHGGQKASKQKGYQQKVSKKGYHKKRGPAKEQHKGYQQKCVKRGYQQKNEKIK